MTDGISKKILPLGLEPRLLMEYELKSYAAAGYAKVAFNSGIEHHMGVEPIFSVWKTEAISVRPMVHYSRCGS